MIKKEDIKVGLKFFLPCERIERYEDMFLYFVNTRENCYLGLSEPTKAFCVKSVEDNCVCCDVDGRTNVYVTLDILQEKGSITVKKSDGKMGKQCDCKNLLFAYYSERLC